jgi:hypothetical protein
VNGGTISGGTPKAKIFIILHEIAHGVETPGFLPDFNNPTAGKINDTLINDNCGNTLKKFK